MEQTRELHFGIPWFPDPQLMPNRKAHWSVTKSLKGDARWHGKMFTPTKGTAWVRECERIEVLLTFWAGDRRKRDLDNLQAAAKALLDGIADALGVDDRTFVVRTLPADEEQRPDSQHPAFVEVQVRPWVKVY